MRRICFVTGTRAEFGLMDSTLRAIRGRADLALQIVVTGMHLSAAHGRTADNLVRDGWRIDRIVEWAAGASLDAATGRAMAGLAEAFAALDPDIVLVVGDRVEPFAAAAAAHLDGRVVPAALTAAVRAAWAGGHPRRWHGENVYGGEDAGRQIAEALACLVLDDRLKRKLIAY